MQLDYYTTTLEILLCHNNIENMCAKPLSGTLQRIYRYNPADDVRILASMLSVPNWSDTDVSQLYIEISIKLLQLNRHSNFILLSVGGTYWYKIADVLSISESSFQSISHLIATCIVRLLSCPKSIQLYYTRYSTGLPTFLYDRSVHTVDIRKTPYGWYVRGINLGDMFGAIYVQRYSRLPDRNCTWYVSHAWTDRFTVWFESLNRIKSLFHYTAIKIISMNVPFDTLVDTLSESLAIRVLQYSTRQYILR